MARANKKCHTCGKEYYFCTSCPKDKRDPKIYTMWCGERCQKIFRALTDETLKNIATSECKKKLMDLGLSLNETLKEGIRVHAERVLNYTEEVIEDNVEINEKIMVDVMLENTNESLETGEVSEEGTNKTEAPLVKASTPKNKKKKKNK